VTDKARTSGDKYGRPARYNLFYVYEDVLRDRPVDQVHLKHLLMLFMCILRDLGSDAVDPQSAKRTALHGLSLPLSTANWEAIGCHVQDELQAIEQSREAVIAKFQPMELPDAGNNTNGEN
jgi:hypothetical protein